VINAITRRKIEKLADEAAAHGDQDQVGLCHRALDGDSDAIEACCRVLDDAEAQREVAL
jgi:hypothetical protein